MQSSYTLNYLWTQNCQCPDFPTWCYFLYHPESSWKSVPLLSGIFIQATKSHFYKLSRSIFLIFFSEDGYTSTHKSPNTSVPSWWLTICSEMLPQVISGLWRLRRPQLRPHSHRAEDLPHHKGKKSSSWRWRAVTTFLESSQFFTFIKDGKHLSRI